MDKVVRHDVDMAKKIFDILKTNGEMSVGRIAFAIDKDAYDDEHEFDCLKAEVRHTLYAMHKMGIVNQTDFLPGIRSRRFSLRQTKDSPEVSSLGR